MTWSHSETAISEETIRRSGFFKVPRMGAHQLWDVEGQFGEFSFAICGVSKLGTQTPRLNVVTLNKFAFQFWGVNSPGEIIGVGFLAVTCHLHKQHNFSLVTLDLYCKPRTLQNNIRQNRIR